jgi:hypothetical protein
MDADIQAELKLPLEFVSFAHIDAKMYWHFNRDSVFTVPFDHRMKWGNTKVYGALFVCKDIEFYIGALDAYHVCSKIKLYKNHIKDLHHRIEVDSTPLFFDTLDDLARLKYREGNIIRAVTYFGNTQHPKIMSRFKSNHSFRVIDGIDKMNFIKLFGRVANE